MKLIVFAVAVLGMGLSASSFGHESKTRTDKSEKRAISTEEKAFGREGSPKNVRRTIAIDMSDRMRFTPSVITIRKGETVRFDVKNSGQTMHEMVLGTREELEQHAELMRKHPGMEHDDPHMAHVAPGKRERIVWQFTKAGEFYYGCLIPGHFEAGMIGKLIVR